MTNDDRRAFANLLLMCHEHHVETDDEARFPVEVMRRMKAEHEERFSGEGNRRMAAAIFDVTRDTPPFYGTTLERMATVLWPEMSEEDMLAIAADLRELADRLAHLPAPTRGLLAVLIARGRPSLGRPDVLQLPARELGEATGSNQHESRERMATLEGLGFADYGEEEGIVTVEAVPNHMPWPIWTDLRGFCDLEGLSVETLVREIRFDLLGFSEHASGKSRGSVTSQLQGRHQHLLRRRRAIRHRALQLPVAGSPGRSGRAQCRRRSRALTAAGRRS
jgi:hypothetical protein